jgi:hypothetical protein
VPTFTTRVVSTTHWVRQFSALRYFLQHISHKIRKTACASLHCSRCNLRTHRVQKYHKFCPVTESHSATRTDACRLEASLRSYRRYPASTSRLPAMSSLSANSRSDLSPDERA